MSHSVTVNVALNLARELKLLNEVKTQLQDISSQYGKYLQEEMKDINIKIKELQQSISKIEGQTFEQEVVFKYLANFSKVIKDIANLKYSLNYGSIITKLLEEDDREINKLLKEYGLMSILCLEDLKQVGQAITPSNLIVAIEKKRQTQLDATRTQSIKNELELTFIKASLPDAIKRALIYHFQQDNYTYQEIMDLSAYIESKILAFKKMQSLGADVINALQDINFKHKETSYKVTPEGELQMIIKAYKDGTKDFLLTIDSKSSMHWQFGDYENHMCDADGTKFREVALPKYQVQTAGMVITRNTSHARPNFKATTLKLKEK